MKSKIGYLAIILLAISLLIMSNKNNVQAQGESPLWVCYETTPQQKTDGSYNIHIGGAGSWYRIVYGNTTVLGPQQSPDFNNWRPSIYGVYQGQVADSDKGPWTNNPNCNFTISPPTSTPTSTSTLTLTPTITLTPTLTSTITLTSTPTSTLTPTPTSIPSLTPTGTVPPSQTPTATQEPTLTPTPTQITNTPIPSFTPTATNTPGSPTPTPTPGTTQTATGTPTSKPPHVKVGAECVDGYGGGNLKISGIWADAKNLKVELSVGNREFFTQTNDLGYFEFFLNNSLDKSTSEWVYSLRGQTAKVTVTNEAGAQITGTTDISDTIFVDCMTEGGDSVATTINPPATTSDWVKIPGFDFKIVRKLYSEDVGILEINFDGVNYRTHAIHEKFVSVKNGTPMDVSKDGVLIHYILTNGRLVPYGTARPKTPTFGTCGGYLTDENGEPLTFGPNKELQFAGDYIYDLVEVEESPPIYHLGPNLAL